VTAKWGLRRYWVAAPSKRQSLVARNAANGMLDQNFGARDAVVLHDADVSEGLNVAVVNTTGRLWGRHVWVNNTRRPRAQVPASRFVHDRAGDRVDRLWCGRMYLARWLPARRGTKWEIFEPRSSGMTAKGRPGEGPAYPCIHLSRLSNASERVLTTATSKSGKLSSGLDATAWRVNDQARGCRLQKR
jgi:hypothetical protein